MSSSLLSKTGRALRALWWFVDAGRRTLLNVLFLALLAAGLWLALRPGAPPLQPKTALVLDLAGPVVEQRSGTPRDEALAVLGGGDARPRGWQLRDVLRVLDEAARDPAIGQAVLLLDDFAGAGLPTLREIAAAIDRFKAAGKPVIAWGSAFDQRDYFLAARASELWLHPQGTVWFQGYGRLRNYWREAFDRVGVKATVLRVGRFKNAGETFSAAGPSAETTESEKFLYDDLWAQWTEGVETARKLPAGSIARVIDGLPGTLQAVGGDAAKLALEQRWVDALKTRDELRAALVERGAKSDDGKSFRQIGAAAYLARLKPHDGGGAGAVGVVVAEGTISDGTAPPGRIGGLSTAALIRQARDDERIKALVLRVNSPGGSAFGSELVRRELELTRAAGKPVVVSMGDVAASGGYWISLAADEVLADPATITGSIGVLAILPSVQGAMDKLGLRTGGYGTTWLATAGDPRRELDPRLAAMVQSAIEQAYGRFTTLAAAARRTTPEKIDAVGQGRVWTGRQALERGLVDRAGGLTEAIARAARLARLEAGERGPRVRYLDREPGRWQRLWDTLGGGSAAAGLAAQALLWLAPETAVALGAAAVAGGAAAAEPLRHDLQWLAEVAERRQPFAAVVHCLCEGP